MNLLKKKKERKTSQDLVLAGRTRRTAAMEKPRRG